MSRWGKLFIGIIVVALALWPGLVLAQGETPQVIIHKAELATDSPKVTIELSVVEQGAETGVKVVPGLTVDNFKVFEDDQAVAPGDLTVTGYAPGNAVAVVLDTGQNIVKGKGVTSSTRWGDVHDFSDDRNKNGLINELVKFRLNDPEDWIGFVGVTKDITGVVTTPLARDQNIVLNAVTDLQPYNGLTPLRAGIDQALKAFEAPDLPKNLQRSIVVFSDGIDITKNPDEFSDLIRRAEKAGITFYTVGMASPKTANGFESVGLERLAKQTNGAFVKHDSPEQRAKVLEMFDRIAGQRQQYRLTYPTHAHAGEHNLLVRVTAPGGSAEATTNFVSALQMPSLSIAVDKTGVMKGDKVNVTPQWKLNDNYNHQTTKIEYLVGGKIISTVTGLMPFVWDTSTVPDTAAEYPIEARAYDSILVDEPPAISNQVKVKIEIPAPTQVVNSVGQNWLGLLLLPIVVLLLIIVIPNRKKISQTARATTQRLQVATRRLSPASAGKYKLMALSLGQEFALTEKIVRVGRDPNSIVALNDPSVSLAHADLIEDQSGNYMIADLTSTNGTYVNGQRLPAGPGPGQPGATLLLRPGDVIRLGAVELRFDYAKATRRLP
jgi:hypothetical protein